MSHARKKRHLRIGGRRLQRNHKGKHAGGSLRVGQRAVAARADASVRIDRRDLIRLPDAPGGSLPPGATVRVTSPMPSIVSNR